jgi:hypothetical protein
MHSTLPIKKEEMVQASDPGELQGLTQRIGVT